MKKTGKVRNNRLICLTNEEEKKLIEGYLRRYKITNRSRWMREIILTFVYQNLGQDYPTIFPEQDMRR